MHIFITSGRSVARPRPRAARCVRAPPEAERRQTRPAKCAPRGSRLCTKHRPGAGRGARCSRHRRSGRCRRNAPQLPLLSPSRLTAKSNRHALPRQVCCGLIGRGEKHCTRNERERERRRASVITLTSNRTGRACGRAAHGPARRQSQRVRLRRVRPGVGAPVERRRRRRRSLGRGLEVQRQDGDVRQ